MSARFDKARAEKIIRALHALQCDHANITRILNYEFDMPDVVFVSTNDPKTGRVTFSTLLEQGGHLRFLEL